MTIKELLFNLNVYFLELFIKIQSIPILNSFLLFFTLLFSLFLFKFFRNNNLFLFSFSLPATFFHELTHFMVSFILFGKPKKISIIPKRSENGWTLGYVESHNLNWLNQSFVALAPFLLFPLFIFFLEYSLEEQNLYYLILKGYILANLLYGTMPSSVDFKLAIQKPFPVILLIIIFVYFLLYNK